MNTLQITNGLVHIKLSAEQCAKLARACHTADGNALTGEFYTLGALFQACAIAGFSQGWIGRDDQAKLEQDLITAQLTISN
ncbi:MAG: hypothetical protein DRJ03_14050 [Chloroflexi bacterium]|nr:MAG: hypothetical protein DRJ03_14050 [Chloroflexota bacterium]